MKKDYLNKLYYKLNNVLSDEECINNEILDLTLDIISQQKRVIKELEESYNSNKLIDKQLDLLIEMANYCKTMERISTDKSKCFNCKIHFNFNLGNHGCFLVETLENKEFINILIDTCKYQDVKYKEKLDKVMEIYDEEYSD